MNEYQEGQARECLLKAAITKSGVEQQNWLALADGWLTLCTFERKMQHEMQVVQNKVDSLVRETLADIRLSSKTAQTLEWPPR
jgi:hypothetical protein